MGHLGIPINPNKGKQENKYYKHSNYSNSNAVGNLIRYITRTRENEDREKDLIAFGAVGACYYFHPDDIIKQFLFVQNGYAINSRGGKRMYHEVFNLYDCEAAELNYDRMQLFWLGMKCSQIYFKMGFQTVFAVHWEEGKHYHIHFAVNSINFTNGRKWHTSLEEIKQREDIFNQILFKQQIILKGTASPIIFSDRLYSEG